MKMQEVITALRKEVPALAHETELKNAAAPTCTRQGYSGDQICKHCGKVIAVGETLPAAGHKAELRNAVKASCTEAGYTGDEVCSVCGETLKKGDVIPAKGHVWGDWKVTRPATTEAEGQETRVCTACGDAETRAIPKVIPTEPDNPFTDVSEGAYYYDAVLWAVKHEPQITQGTSETMFSPDAACTRAQIVTFLWRAKGCPEPKSTSNPFTDVKSSDYFFKAVLWAVEQGVTNGVTPGRFDPNGSCTRGQAVTFLWRAEGNPAPTAQTSGYSDVQNPSSGQWRRASQRAERTRPSARTPPAPAARSSRSCTATRLDPSKKKGLLRQSFFAGVFLRLLLQILSIGDTLIYWRYSPITEAKKIWR